MYWLRKDGILIKIDENPTDYVDGIKASKYRFVFSYKATKTIKRKSRSGTLSAMRRKSII